MVRERRSKHAHHAHPSTRPTLERPEVRTQLGRPGHADIRGLVVPKLELHFRQRLVNLRVVWLTIQQFSGTLWQQGLAAPLPGG